MKLGKVVAGSLVGAAMLGFGSAANAAIIVNTGNDAGGTSNVVSNPCSPTLETGPALTVQGCLNNAHNIVVDFTSNENLIFNGGQARIEAEVGTFSELTIALNDNTLTFSKLILNINANADGFVTFTGVPGGTSGQFAIDKNGQNFFTITGEDFQSVSFVTTVGVNAVELVSDVRQVRLGGIAGVPPEPVPEPASLALLGMGLLGLGYAMRRRRAH